MKTTVVNLYKEPYDISIMRPNPFGNPFYLKNTNDEIERIECVLKFVAYFSRHPLLQEKALRDLPGKRLGCCCKPKLCHGDPIARFVNGETLKSIEADLKKQLQNLESNRI
jgi:hypothetical protein